MAAPTDLPAALSVFVPEGRIGTLHPGDPLVFSYWPAWLERPGAMPLHPDIALAPRRIDSSYVIAFFENLLPEGAQRTLVAMREQVSSVYGLLCKVGGESAGAVVLLPEGEQPQAPVYQRLTWSQVEYRAARWAARHLRTSSSPTSYVATSASMPPRPTKRS